MATRPQKAKSGQQNDKARKDDMLRGVSHELRVDVLRILNEREASPNEMAGSLRVPLGRLSYHVNKLKREGVIEETRTVQRRGALEHFYRATVPAKFDDESWAKLPVSARQRISRTVLQVLFSETAAAQHEGTFDERPDRHLSWMPFPVDEEGWGELTAALEKSLDDVEQVKRASAERIAKSGEAGRPVIAALLGYVRATKP